MNTKNNRRSHSSAARLTHAMLELSESMAGKRITVKQVCERAGVNRSTFYAHFHDIYDVVEKTEIFLIEELRASFSPFAQCEEVPFDDFFTICLRHIHRHHFFYSATLKSELGFPPKGRAREERIFLYERIIKPQCLKAGITDPAEIEYYTAFFQAGLNTLLNLWISGGCQIDEEQMKSILKNCIPQICAGEHT